MSCDTVRAYSGASGVMQYAGMWSAQDSCEWGLQVLYK